MNTYTVCQPLVPHGGSMNPYMLRNATDEQVATYHSGKSARVLLSFESEHELEPFPYRLTETGVLLFGRFELCDIAGEKRVRFQAHVADSVLARLTFDLDSISPMHDTLALDWEWEDLGVTDSQSFQGAGVSGTRFDDCATGCGTTLREAYDDALESLAQGGWDVGAVSCDLFASEDAKELDVDQIPSSDDADGSDDDFEPGEVYQYVVVRVSSEKEGS